MSSTFQHFRDLYEKYRTSSATEAEIEEFFDYLRNPENLEILKEEMIRGWVDESGRKVESPVKWQDIQLEIRKKKALERRSLRLKTQKMYWWAAAASILVIAAVSLGIFFMNGSDEFITYTTGFGQVEKIVLDDGSEVTLNANSELKWKPTWQKDEKRLVVLTGEAFFTVASVLNEVTNQKMGFDVQTQDLTIQVVGTSFNVKSRTEKTDIFLKEGKILLDLKEGENELSDALKGSKREKIEMLPGESVSYSATTEKLEKAESDQYGNASWMAGTFMYSNKSVREILQSLQDIYGVRFEVEDRSILDRKLTTNLPYSDWPIVESGLELLLQVKLEKKDNNTIIIKKE